MLIVLKLFRRRIENEIRRQKQEDLTDQLLASQFKIEFPHSKPNMDKVRSIYHGFVEYSITLPVN